MKQLIPVLSFLIILSSCKKEEITNAQITGLWNWTIQYLGNPANSLTPQNTGVNESILFTLAGAYAIKKNSLLVNSGTYKVVNSTNARGQKIMAVSYSNSRITDSLAYFIMSSNDTLSFSNDFSGNGSIGAGARVYGK